MSQHLKIEGIYDSRTLKLLKEKGIRDFGFNFSPKSFNFIQEHVFLGSLVPLLDSRDRIHLHFTDSRDPMIEKVLKDLKMAGVLLENVYLECDEWSETPEKFSVHYYLNYHSKLEISACSHPLFAGIIFDYSYMEDLQKRGILNNFIANFYTHFSRVLSDDKKIVLRLDWDHNVFPTLFEYFDVDLMSLSINSKIEVCYRNVDLKKLKVEMDMLEKNKTALEKF